MTSASTPASSFAPPPEPSKAGSFALALVAHGFLIAALAWGTTWRSRVETVTVSAELWSDVLLQAAPPLAVQPAPAPEPEPPRAPEKEPHIVTEKVKPKASVKEKMREKTKEPIKPAPHTKADPKADATKQREEKNNQLREQLRQDQIKRMAGLAGGVGTASNAGTAPQNTGPSSSYRDKVKAKIRPNIVFQNAGAMEGDLTVEIAIRLAPDGTIALPLRITKSSGNAAWDSAVLRGVEKTETLPRDQNGQFPAPFTLVWHLKE